MTLDECTPGRNVWWRHTHQHTTYFKAARVLKRTPKRVWVIIQRNGYTVRRCIAPARLTTHRF